MKNIYKYTLVLFILFIRVNLGYGQTVIHMIEDMGVYKIPCEINGLKVKMIFDTGAAKVSISQSLAEMMFENGYISLSDMSGEGGRIIGADGKVIEHSSVLLKNIKIGNLSLNNVEAIIVHQQSAPLLLGQTAISRLGKISIQGDKLYITPSGTQTSSDYADTRSERWDATKYSYSNYKYGFGWTLPSEFSWEKMDGHEKHTVFRVEGGPFTVFVNVNQNDSSPDLWTIYDKFTSIIEKLDVEIEKKTGEINYERTFQKVNLCGQHAVKSTNKRYFKDDRYSSPLEYYIETYYLIWDYSTFIITVSVPKVVYDEYDCEGSFRDLFRGFRLSVKQ